MQPENPYAAPSSDLTTVASTNDAERTRQEHIAHEASVKSIAVLFLLGAVVMVFGGLAMLVAAVHVATTPSGDGDAIMGGALGAIYLLLGILQGTAAVGLRRLRSWGRVLGIMFSLLGLLGVPIGTIVSAYFLYLLLSRKGRVVFSPEYQQVIAQTPHIKYRTSIIVKIFLGILLALLALIVVFALLGTP